jgi:hypothetical protein
MPNRAPNKRTTIPVVTRWLPCALALFVTIGCSSNSDGVPGALGNSGQQPPPVQQPTLIERLALDGSLQRENAAPLASVRLIEIPQDATDTEAQQLLGDGTLYRLELDRLGSTGAALVRFDDVAGAAPVATRIPLVAPAGQEIRTDKFSRGLRVATSTPGVLMDRNKRGSVWWEEDGPKGRLIEFRIDGDRAKMVPPGAPLDDPTAPVAHRFNLTHGREVAYRFTTGAVNISAGVPRAFLGGRGFSLAVARIGNEQTEAFLESPAADIPHVDVAEPAPGLLAVTIGYVVDRGCGRRWHVTRQSETLADHRSSSSRKLRASRCADVGPSGVLAVLGLPWNATGDDPEDRPLLDPSRPAGATPPAAYSTPADSHAARRFVALFADEFKQAYRPTISARRAVLRRAIASRCTYSSDLVAVPPALPGSAEPLRRHVSQRSGCRVRSPGPLNYAEDWSG